MHPQPWTVFKLPILGLFSSQGPGEAMNRNAYLRANYPAWGHGAAESLLAHGVGFTPPPRAVPGEVALVCVCEWVPCQGALYRSGRER